MADPEVIVCDTSLVGVLDRAAADTRRTAHWPEGVRSRLDRAVLAISVVTDAEVRAGWRYGGWGATRMAAAELRLLAYLAIPVDRGALGVWSELSADCKQRGLTISDNDLWIAATAMSRDLPLATCDRDHDRIDDRRLEVVFLPPNP